MAEKAAIQSQADESSVPFVLSWTYFGDFLKLVAVLKMISQGTASMLQESLFLL
jgi:hypothetical protein